MVAKRKKLTRFRVPTVAEALGVTRKGLPILKKIQEHIDPFFTSQVEAGVDPAAFGRLMRMYVDLLAADAVNLASHPKFKTIAYKRKR